MNIKEIKIGDTRTFEKYPGKWEVIKIIENKNIQYKLRLGAIKCPHCGGIIGEERVYIFNHIEKLKQNDEIKHLGISDCGRYVILEEFLSKEELTNGN